MKDLSQNVILLNVNIGSVWCRALRKKTMAQASDITTVCGDTVPGITEVHRPGVAVVTCSRCRAIERGGRDTANSRVVPRSAP